MAVYVDDVWQPIGPWRCCRMVADTVAELRAMAEAIDVAPRWERVIDGVPGFRLTALRRRWAVAHGAIAVDTAALDHLAGRAAAAGRGRPARSGGSGAHVSVRRAGGGRLSPAYPAYRSRLVVV